MLQEDLASGRTAAEAAKEADARREANRRRREAEAAAEVKSPVLVRARTRLVPPQGMWCIPIRVAVSVGIPLLVHVIGTHSERLCLLSAEPTAGAGGRV